jgi:acyl carrier protein
MTTEELKIELKEHIIAELNLEDITPEEISDEKTLFGEDLGLDSIDALELVVLLEKFYDVKIRDEEEGKKVLFSVNTMAERIEQQQALKN